MISKLRQRYDSMAETGENVILTEWQRVWKYIRDFC